MWDFLCAKYGPEPSPQEVQVLLKRASADGAEDSVRDSGKRGGGGGTQRAPVHDSGILPPMSLIDATIERKRREKAKLQSSKNHKGRQVAMQFSIRLFGGDFYRYDEAPLDAKTRFRTAVELDVSRHLNMTATYVRCTDIRSGSIIADIDVEVPDDANVTTTKQNTPAASRAGSSNRVGAVGADGDDDDDFTDSDDSPSSHRRSELVLLREHELKQSHEIKIKSVGVLVEELADSVFAGRFRINNTRNSYRDDLLGNPVSLYPQTVVLDGENLMDKRLEHRRRMQRNPLFITEEVVGAQRSPSHVSLTSAASDPPAASIHSQVPTMLAPRKGDPSQQGGGTQYVILGADARERRELAAAVGEVEASPLGIRYGETPQQLAQRREDAARREKMNRAREAGDLPPVAKRDPEGGALGARLAMKQAAGGIASPVKEKGSSFLAASPPRAEASFINNIWRHDKSNAEAEQYNHPVGVRGSSISPGRGPRYQSKYDFYQDPANHTSRGHPQNNGKSYTTPASQSPPRPRSYDMPPTVRDHFARGAGGGAPAAVAGNHRESAMEPSSMAIDQLIAEVVECDPSGIQPRTGQDESQWPQWATQSQPPSSEPLSPPQPTVSSNSRPTQPTIAPSHSQHQSAATPVPLAATSRRNPSRNATPRGSPTERSNASRGAVGVPSDQQPRHDPRDQ
jgi:hypothetical protein